MQIEYEVEQVSLFDLVGWCGKMCPEHLAQQREKISAQYSKKSFGCRTEPLLFLDLTPGVGNLLGQSYWEINSAWLGACSTLNTGACPNDVVESSLSQILEDSPHQKYYLSKTACLGILRRASERGKTLPPQLEKALKIQANIEFAVST